MSLPTCPYTPDQANYTINGRADSSVVEVALDGGMPATRLDKLGAVSSVTVTWSLSLDKGTYAILVGFWKATVALGTLPFNIPLVLDGGLATYQAKFQKGSFGLQSVQGDTYVVAAALWVQEP